jgi:hypothetical protein
MKMCSQTTKKQTTRVSFLDQPGIDEEINDPITPMTIPKAILITVGCVVPLKMKYTNSMTQFIPKPRSKIKSHTCNWQATNEVS